MGVTILVTGAGGFLGRSVVLAAQNKGHNVIAVVRRPTEFPDGVAVRISDLSVEAPDLTGIDAVIHCAAKLAGTDDEHEQQTLGQTRRLVSAIQSADSPPRLVLVSSLSVYGYGPLRPYSTVTEATPLETSSGRRDAYTRAKLAQEQIAKDAMKDLWLVRAGALYGKGRAWNAHVGAGFGPILLRIGKSGEIPLVHVEDCAQALVCAAERPPKGAIALNLVGDDCPNRIAFLDAFRASGWPKLSLPLPWRLLDIAGRVLRPFGSLPGLLRPEVLRARMMPLRYSNAAAKSALGWTPQTAFKTGIAQALEVTR